MYVPIYKENWANICIKAMHRIIYNIKFKGFGHRWHVQHFTSSAALLYLWILWVSFLLLFSQWFFSDAKQKTIFNEPIQLLHKSKLLEKCCRKTINKRKQRKICTCSYLQRSLMIWKSIEERNWKCICIKVPTVLQASHPKETPKEIRSI